MWYNVTSQRTMTGSRPSTGSKRNREWVDKAVAGKFIISRRGRIYGPPPPAPEGEKLEKTAENLQQNMVGRMQIAGHGTFWRHYHRETWRQREVYYQTVGSGDKKRRVKRVRWVSRSSTTDRHHTDLLEFSYKMNVYGKEYLIMYDAAACGPFATAKEMVFKAVDMAGMPLFLVRTDAGKWADVQTFSNSDPVNALIAAFAIAVRLDPKEFHAKCDKYCMDTISLDSLPGFFGGFGPPDAEFEGMCGAQISASCATRDAALAAAAEQQRLQAEMAAAAAAEAEAAAAAKAQAEAAAAYAVQAQNPSEGVVLQPFSGYAYGVAVEGLPLAEPVAMPVGQPFTQVEQQVAFEALPMAIPLATPVIGESADPIPMAIPIGEPWDPPQVEGAQKQVEGDGNAESDGEEVADDDDAEEDEC
jgi:hypothetical protein